MGSKLNLEHRRDDIWLQDGSLVYNAETLEREDEMLGTAKGYSSI